MPLLKTVLEGLLHGMMTNPGVKLIRVPGVKFMMAQYPDLFIVHFSIHSYTKFCAFITKCTIVNNFLLCHLTKLHFMLWCN